MLWKQQFVNITTRVKLKTFYVPPREMPIPHSLQNSWYNLKLLIPVSDFGPYVLVAQWKQHQTLLCCLAACTGEHTGREVELSCEATFLLTVTNFFHETQMWVYVEIRGVFPQLLHYPKTLNEWHEQNKVSFGHTCFASCGFAFSCYSEIQRASFLLLTSCFLCYLCYVFSSKELNQQYLTWIETFAIGYS